MIAIIDYKAGNLTSVYLAFESLGIDAEVTNDPSTIARASRVVFPGDGAARSAMDHLQELGLTALIPKLVADGKPFLGVCLGTQIILEHSDENDGVDCLGIIPGRVLRFEPSDKMVKIPQMGWNTVTFKVTHPLFDGIDDGSEFYFIHSYFPSPAQACHILGETDYADETFASIMGRENLVATQFHPERSGRIGLQLLENFSRWDGSC